MDFMEILRAWGAGALALALMGWGGFKTVTRFSDIAHRQDKIKVQADQDRTDITRALDLLAEHMKACDDNVRQARVERRKLERDLTEKLDRQAAQLGSISKAFSEITGFLRGKGLIDN